MRNFKSLKDSTCFSTTISLVDRYVGKPYNNAKFQYSTEKPLLPNEPIKYF